jgi:hypothetical protein
MTKVQVHFRLQKPLDDRTLARVDEVHTLYGIQQVRLAPSLDGLMVEYDATRLRPAEVEAALMAAGIALEPAS